MPKRAPRQPKRRTVTSPERVRRNTRATAGAKRISSPERTRRNTTATAGRKRTTSPERVRRVTTSTPRKRTTSPERVRRVTTSTSTKKKDTRSRGGSRGGRGAMDQAAFHRFVNMTPAQQRHVMRMAPGETRRKAR